MTYDNSRIPQALIVAGYMLGRQEMTDLGLRVLRWLVDLQRSSNGHVSFVGNDGWFRRGGARAIFDQQPLEAAAMIGACKAAYRASGEFGQRVLRRVLWSLGHVLAHAPEGSARELAEQLFRSSLNSFESIDSLRTWTFPCVIRFRAADGQTASSM